MLQLKKLSTSYRRFDESVKMLIEMENFSMVYL